MAGFFIMAQTYINGSYEVTIKRDGTLIRKELNKAGKIDFPISMDIKLTDYCDLGCAYCHESSTKEGKHADLDKLFTLLDDYFPKGVPVEHAYGGGNPLAHPDIITYLEKVKKRGFIANLTVNQGHLTSPVLDKILKKDLISGLGVSVTSKNFQRLAEICRKTPNVVIHLIAGVHHPSIIDEIDEYVGQKCKYLILGYKSYGFGVNYKSEAVEDNIALWCFRLRRLFKEGRTLSFDNLALEQLDTQHLVKQEQWQTNYLGEDFTFSMYIDAVKQEMAKTSRNADRYNFNDITIKQFFNDKQFGN